jgi:predicted Rdx family selenoprotein
MEGGSGVFEIRIVGGRVLHSQKSGQGFVDTKEKLQHIIDGIRAAMSSNVAA